MSALVAALVQDLRAFCADLLAAGMAQVGMHPAAATHDSTTFGRMFRQIDALERMLPELVATVASVEDWDQGDWVRTRLPMRASFPRSPGDWGLDRDRLVPRHWGGIQPRTEPDPRPLRFILHVLQRLQGDFHDVHKRLQRHIEDARISRAGFSVYAAADAALLKQMSVDLESRASRLRRIGMALAQAAPGRLFADERLPLPFPRSPVWISFRRLADEIMRPGRVFDRMAIALRGAEPPLADLPFLYQRWVGLKLLTELKEGFGFQPVGDPTGPLFLGGCITLRRRELEIQLWCEPRLGHQPHPCGLVVTSHAALAREATPDYVLVTPGTGGPDAFVLDATLSKDPTLIARKASYRSRLVFHEFRAVAGVPGRRPPLRAWAAVPIGGAHHNQLSLPDGSAGCIPMHPGNFDHRPLRSWLGDLVDHAEARHLLALERARSPRQPLVADASGMASDLISQPVE
jgi:hypothetical protein